MLTHTRERPHKCHVCESTFLHISNLKRHLKKIHGEKKQSSKQEDKAADKPQENGTSTTEQPMDQAKDRQENLSDRQMEGASQAEKGNRSDTPQSCQDDAQKEMADELKQIQEIDPWKDGYRC